MIEGQEDVSWDQWVALARACEEHGLEGLFRSDHYLSVFDRSQRGSLDAWTTLAGLAALTSRIRLGTLVSPATFRHPSVLAKSVVTADHISGGRVELGLGAGWHEREHRGYGFPFGENGTRMDVLEEQAEMIHRLWSDDRVTFQGRHYRLDDVRPFPKPLQRPHPPVIVGGHAGARSAALAARWADEYNVYHRTPEECRSLRARLGEAWEREDRDPDTLVFSVMTGVVVGRDRDEVDAAADRVAEVTGQDRASVLGSEASVVGTVDQVASGLRDYESAGVGRMMLQHLAHDDLDTVALLGQEVAPAVA
jgi:F420-dependent oxidoreductase-like protein